MQKASERQDAERLVSVGKLAAGVAHDCGSMLNVVMGRAQMIASGEVKGDEACAYATKVVEQSKRMAAVLRNLLAYARGEPLVPPEGDDAHCTLLPAGEVVRATVALLVPFAKKNMVVLEVDDPDGAEVLSVPPVLTQQVLTNVVINTVSAMPDGGRLKLGLARADKVKGGSRIECVCLSVSATGPRASLVQGLGSISPITRRLLREINGWVEVAGGGLKGRDVLICLPCPAESAGDARRVRVI